jgi:hypothetical protein
MLGLRVRCVVVISSDSDYSAAGVYDDLNNVGIHLVVVNTSAIKRSLLETESECRRFVHLEDLLRRLPVPPSFLPGFGKRGGTSMAAHSKVKHSKLKPKQQLGRRASHIAKQRHRALLCRHTRRCKSLSAQVKQPPRRIVTIESCKLRS